MRSTWRTSSAQRRRWHRDENAIASLRRTHDQVTARLERGESTLQEIERDNFAVLNQRVSLTPLRKLWLAWRVQALGRL